MQKLPVLIALSALQLALGAGCIERSFPEGLACEGADQSCPPGFSCLPRGGGWVACYSSEEAVVPFVCNALDQDCIESMACYWNPLGQSGPQCDLPGTARPGDGCVKHSDCESQSGCHPAPGTMSPRSCYRYCDRTDLMACPPAEVCAPLEDNLGICVFQSCSPHATQSECAPMKQCYFDDQTDTGLCSLPGAGGQDAACTGPADCQTGLHCFDCTGGIRTCSAYCNPANGHTDCTTVPGAPVCTPFAAPNDHIGACSPCS